MIGVRPPGPEHEAQRDRGGHQRKLAEQQQRDLAAREAEHAQARQIPAAQRRARRARCCRPRRSRWWPRKGQDRRSSPACLAGVLLVEALDQVVGARSRCRRRGARAGAAQRRRLARVDAQVARPTPRARREQAVQIGRCACRPAARRRRRPAGPRGTVVGAPLALAAARPAQESPGRTPSTLGQLAADQHRPPAGSVTSRASRVEQRGCKRGCAGRPNSATSRWRGPARTRTGSTRSPSASSTPGRLRQLADRPRRHAARTKLTTRSARFSTADGLDQVRRTRRSEAADTSDRPPPPRSRAPRPRRAAAGARSRGAPSRPTARAAGASPQPPAARD